ncbi:MAG: MFS transporter, partial [Alphaproteobacteria bacterium]|nr:MFS transporter [Alphaproteobacteria bacterium]
MTGTATPVAPVAAAPVRAARSTLATCGGVHALHDGFSDAIYLFLPIWQAEFGLTLAQTGALKALYSLGMAGLQLPASMLAERIGERAVLAGGTILVGLGFLSAGWSGAFRGLAAAMLLTGIGAAVQHPLSSSLIARSAAGTQLRVALSTYNFLGDVGKVVVPATVALAVAAWSWRPAVDWLGLLAIATGLLILPLLRPGA